MCKGPHSHTHTHTLTLKHYNEFCWSTARSQFLQLLFEIALLLLLCGAHITLCKTALPFLLIWWHFKSTKRHHFSPHCEPSAHTRSRPTSGNAELLRRCRRSFSSPAGDQRPTVFPGYSTHNRAQQHKALSQRPPSTESVCTWVGGLTVCVSSVLMWSLLPMNSHQHGNFNDQCPVFDFVCLVSIAGGCTPTAPSSEVQTGWNLVYFCGMTGQKEPNPNPYRNPNRDPDPDPNPDPEPAAPVAGQLRCSA